MLRSFGAMKAAYLMGAVGTGCALALLYLKSWRKDEQTADQSSTGDSDDSSGEISKGGTSNNREEEVKECESHSLETCLKIVSKSEECGSKSNYSTEQERESCQKVVITNKDDFSTISEEFKDTKSAECEELKECEENYFISCQSVPQENLNCAVDLTEDNVVYDIVDQFYGQLGKTSNHEEVSNYDDKNKNSNIFVNEIVKESSEPNQGITIGGDIDFAQTEDEVQTGEECMKTHYKDELLNRTVEVEEASCIYNQDNIGSGCGTNFGQEEYSETLKQVDEEEFAAPTKESAHNSATEVSTKTKEDTVEELNAAEILTQAKENPVEQLTVTEELTCVEEDPIAKLSVTEILTQTKESIVKPMSVSHFVKYSESEKESSIGEDSLEKNVTDLSQEGGIVNLCKDNGNGPLAKEETEHLESTDTEEPKRKEHLLEQSLQRCLEERQEVGENTETCPQEAEENAEKYSDRAQSFYKEVRDRNCEQILGDDINCNVIVRNNVEGKETITTVEEDQVCVDRNTENCEALTSDLSSSSEILEMDKALEESTTTEISEADKAHQDCTTTDLEQVFSKQVSDSASIASTDSGQGSCEIEPETFFVSTSYPLPPQEYIFYEFVIPQVLVGRLIGKKGAMVNKIRAQTDAHLIILPHNVSKKYKICSVEGTKDQVDAALDMIRKHFPLSRYPDVTLERVNQQPCTQRLEACFNAATLQLELPAGVVSEVQVCSIMSPCQFFVHLPLHPSHGNMARLLQCMNTNYGDGSTTPALPQPVSVGTVCAALVNGQWQRCMVVSCEENCCSVNLLDLGGLVYVPFENLRQIRSDYLTLPFQAAQCLLHGVNSTTESWSDTTYAAFEELVSDTILFATVVAYTEEGIPFVNLYRRENDEYVSINEKLVELGHAKCVTPVGMVA